MKVTEKSGGVHCSGGAVTLPLAASATECMMLDVSTAEIFVRGAAAKEGQGQPAAMNFVLINTPSGWRVLSIVVSRSTSG